MPQNTQPPDAETLKFWNPDGFGSVQPPDSESLKPCIFETLKLWNSGNFLLFTFNFLLPGMYLSKSPGILRSLTRKNLTWDFPGRPGEIFLTFDDGPVPEITPRVLDILDQYQARATFFCVGENVSKHPEVYRQVVDAGHAIGNHTFHHLSGWKTPLNEYLTDIENCNQLVNSRLFRPPYGRLKPTYIKSIKPAYHIIMWSALSGDFDSETSPENVLQNAIQNATDGSIVVFHDSLKAADRLFYALPGFLEYFSKKGFRFSAITPDLFD